MLDVVFAFELLAFVNVVNESFPQLAMDLNPYVLTIKTVPPVEGHELSTLSTLYPQGVAVKLHGSRLKFKRFFDCELEFLGDNNDSTLAQQYKKVRKSCQVKNLDKEKKEKKEKKEIDEITLYNPIQPYT